MRSDRRGSTGAGPQWVGSGSWGHGEFQQLRMVTQGHLASERWQNTRPGGHRHLRMGRGRTASTFATQPKRDRTCFLLSFFFDCSIPSQSKKGQRSEQGGGSGDPEAG
jgi:hypothetical protein